MKIKQLIGIIALLPFLNCGTAQAQAFVIPSTWTDYEIENAFSIWIPPTMELRHEYDTYTKQIKELKMTINTDAIVFQQKGLSDGANNKHYARVLIQHSTGNGGDFLKSVETETLDNETKQYFKQLAEESSKPYKLITEPTYQWVTINNFIKALAIRYRRSASNNYTTHCTMYYLFNYNEMTNITISYREQEKQMWLPDLDNVIKTFSWTKIK